MVTDDSLTSCLNAAVYSVAGLTSVFELKRDDTVDALKYFTQVDSQLLIGQFVQFGDQ